MKIGADLRYIRSLSTAIRQISRAISHSRIGIGATSAMFNVIYSALLNPFPYADADRIVNPS